MADIGLVVDTLGGAGGTEGQTALLAGALIARGHRVTVYCRRVSDCPDGVRPVVVAGPWRVGRHDVVQTHLRLPLGQVYRAGGGAHPAWLRARGGIRVRDALDVWRDRRAVRHARIVVCNSNLAAADLAAAYGVTARVIRNGVDLDRFRPDPARRAAARDRLGVSGKVALFLGTGFRRKGFDVAWRAFEAAGGDHLVVAGRDAHAERWLGPARRALGDRLHVVGPTTDAPDLLRAADALLHPTRYDPSANAVLEALACGVPPVTTARDGASEVVPDLALVVSDPRDVAGCARALVHAWEVADPDGCRRAAEAWPASRTAEATETIYRELEHG